MNDIMCSVGEEASWAIVAALTLMLFDIVAGLAGAVVRHDFSSGKMREGIGHKAMLVLVICLAVVIETFTEHVPSLGFQMPLIVPSCVYITLMEVSSVLETVAGTVPSIADTPLFRIFSGKDDDDA